MSPGFAVPVFAPPGASDDAATEPVVSLVAVLYVVDTAVVVALETYWGSSRMPATIPIVRQTTANIAARRRRERMDVVPG
ncbi:hypothetical protein [Leifsonia xyli]|uniref:hypothetical protein n=1 Tax=Leifsonia xyli TaxID=1575 RepID=UPI003D6708D0